MFDLQRISTSKRRDTRGGVRERKKRRKTEEKEMKHFHYISPLFVSFTFSRPDLIITLSLSYSLVLHSMIEFRMKNGDIFYSSFPLRKSPTFFTIVLLVRFSISIFILIFPFPRIFIRLDAYSALDTSIPFPDYNV